MDWFTSLLLISALALFLWLCVGIYLDVRGRLQSANKRPSGAIHKLKGSGTRQVDMWDNITASHVREAFDLFLRS